MFSAENLLKDSFFVVIVQIYFFINIIHTKTPNLIEVPVVHFCLTTYMPFLKCVSYEVRGRRYQAIGFANLSGGYELRDNKTFKGTIAPKDITPIFEDMEQPVCLKAHGLPVLPFNERRDY